MFSFTKVDGHGVRCPVLTSVYTVCPIYWYRILIVFLHSMLFFACRHKASYINTVLLQLLCRDLYTITDFSGQYLTRLLCCIVATMILTLEIIRCLVMVSSTFFLVFRKNPIQYVYFYYKDKIYYNVKKLGPYTREPIGKFLWQ